MAQYDVYENPSASTSTEFPFLLEVQSNLFRDSSRVVIIPMVRSGSLSRPDKVLNPEFDIGGSRVRLLPLDIASVSNAALENRVCNLTEESDRIFGALDLLFERF